MFSILSSRCISKTSRCCLSRTHTQRMTNGVGELGTIQRVKVKILDAFRFEMANLFDRDGDGVSDLAIFAYGIDDAVEPEGNAIYIYHSTNGGLEVDYQRVPDEILTIDERVDRSRLAEEGTLAVRSRFYEGDVKHDLILRAPAVAESVTPYVDFLYMEA